jgi:hypothetical protein
MKKKVLLFGCMLLFASYVKAQVPQGIPYQAIARNGQGQPLANTNVKVRFSILDSTATGTAVYLESHNTTTSALGLFTANVGMGTASTGAFSSINWGQNYKFLKVELDTTATGNSYIDLGTQQMMSVPYALYAGKAISLNSTTNNNNVLGNGFSQFSTTTFTGTLMQTIQFCSNLTELGYSDWRLPNLDEVFSYISINNINQSDFNLWTLTNSNYNVLGPQGSIFPFTRFTLGEIEVDSPYSNKNSHCVR